MNNDYESSAPELVIFTQVTASNQVVGNHYVLSLSVTENGTGRTASTSRDIVIQYDSSM